MDAAKSVTASFTRRTYTLTVNRTGPGTVTSSTGGIFCGAACSATYDAGATVTLTATPDATATFTGWSGACSGTGTCTVTMDASKTVGASFVVNTYGMSVTKSGSGNGSVISTPSGIDCGTTCTANFDSGTVVTLSAAGAANSTFTGWTGACSGAGACTVTMSAARNVTATFTKNNVVLTVSETGTGGGTVTSSPPGINCGSSCSASYVADTSVTLAATADGSSTFAGWSGACTGTSTCTVTMDSAKNVTATFTRRIYVLTVTRAGSGTITSTPLGIYCGSACSATYDAGATVTLTATPDATATFTGWSGGGCSGTGACTVTMDVSKTVGATFVVNTYVLSVPKAGSGSGTVISTPAGITCGATCSVSYDSGTVVTLSAAPASDSTFTGWSGACSGAGACTVTMSAARTVTATFTKNNYVLVVSKTGTGGGTVTSNPNGITCGASCSASYIADTSVTLAATADGYSTFAGWSGACTGTQHVHGDHGRCQEHHRDLHPPDLRPDSHSDGWRHDHQHPAGHLLRRGLYRELRRGQHGNPDGEPGSRRNLRRVVGRLHRRRRMHRHDGRSQERRRDLQPVVAWAGGERRST